MTNCRRGDISEYNDINTLDQYRLALEAGCSVEEALEVCFRHSRDNARTPMQWSAEKNGGFTTGTPWLGMNPNYVEINVAEQLEREDSVLRYYRRLIALRKADAWRSTFTYGTFAPAYESLDGVMAYTRTDEKNRILVAANFAPEARELPLEGVRQVLLTNLGGEETLLERIRAEGMLTLESCQCAVLLL